ncbi:mitochondrial 37S ribosomal protein MRP2 [Pneumocystis jirovecii RU7]|uniref:Uncharacterized protein n=1 Tax=Pneumocystis jirovecii (strain RU7) TaxID=1408657 RepID=A0A0W4ZV80_PNEJ7|nr:mitochondrial 37S ribosomal protein MRP2 [Pneumocystis jirovecii RU7]KTW32267.1 hypothetical protein T551_00358 [Pneumocystis jirovecii RU7]
MGRRVAAAAAEAERQALRHIVRNTGRAAEERVRAQAQLAAMEGQTRMGRVKNRCIETGRGRGVLRDFGMCRYQFRVNALAGRLPGVKKVGSQVGDQSLWQASW